MVVKLYYLGAGIRIHLSNSSISNGPLANNGLIVAGEHGLRLEFVSNSSELEVGIITGPNGTVSSEDINYIWMLTNNPYGRPGVIRLQINTTALPFTNFVKGIFTCNISDSNSKIISLNVGLYPRDYRGKFYNTVYYTKLSLSLLILHNIQVNQILPHWNTMTEVQ